MSTMFILVIFSHVIIFISINIFSFLIVNNFHAYGSVYSRKSINDSTIRFVSDIPLLRRRTELVEVGVYSAGRRGVLYFFLLQKHLLDSKNLWLFAYRNFFSILVSIWFSTEPLDRATIHDFDTFSS